MAEHAATAPEPPRPSVQVDDRGVFAWADRSARDCGAADRGRDRDWDAVALNPRTPLQHIIPQRPVDVGHIADIAGCVMPIP